MARLFKLGSFLLCLAISTLSCVLFLSILLVGLNVPIGIETPVLGDLIALIFRTTLLPVVLFLAEILKSLFPWPFVALAALTVLVWGPERIASILSAIGKLELPGGIKLEGRAPTESLQKELGEASRVVDSANKEIEEAYASAKVYAAQLRDRYELPKLVEELALEIAALVGSSCPSDYRLTVYVPDFVFGDRLFQLTEYYDKDGKRGSDGKAGRTFSIRFGIIGRVWRSGVPEIEGQLISATDRIQLGPTPDDGELERFIARRWGMTLDEAIHARPYNSYGAIRIDRADKPLGVVFFDSKAVDAFGDTAQLLGAAKAKLAASALPGKLLEISSEVAPWSGRIQIFRNS